MVEEKISPKVPLKHGKMIVRPGQPLQFIEIEDMEEGNNEIDSVVMAIGETLRRYGEAAHTDIRRSTRDCPPEL